MKRIDSTRYENYIYINIESISKAHDQKGVGISLAQQSTCLLSTKNVVLLWYRLMRKYVLEVLRGTMGFRKTHI